MVANEKRISVTILTGAGASNAKPIGLPTMKKFFSDLMDAQHNTNSQRITNKSYFKNMMDILYPDKRGYDLERVMGALYGLSSFTDEDCWNLFLHPRFATSVFDHLKTGINFMNPSRSGYSIPENEVLNKLKIGIERQFETNKSSAEKLLWEMEDLIRETYDRIENEAIRTVYEPLFDVALDAIETSKDASLILPFFTTNYDMSIDWFLRPDHRDNRPQHQEWLHKRRMKMDYVDGFDRDEWSEDVYASSYEPDMITVEYHKLHGSLRWQNVDGVIKRGTSVARDRLMNQKLVIVYPSDKKILTENPFYFCHKKLDEHLMRSDNLIVIGFSFRDPAIVQALNYALLYNTKLVVHIIHPKYEPSDYPEMDSFIKLHKSRVKHKELYFGTSECIEYLTDALLPKKKPSLVSAVMA